MTQNCPVVISNKVNIWREIAAAHAGLVRDCNAAQTADAILRILSESALARQLSENGLRLAREHFTWPVAAEMMEVAYRQLVEHDTNPMKAQHHG